MYVACADGNIYAFNAATGATVSGFPVLTGVNVNSDSTVSAANGRIYEGAYAYSSIYAFDAATGVGIAGYPVIYGGRIESTAAIVGGQIFFGTGDGWFHGIHRSGSSLGGFPVATTGAVVSSPAVGDGRVIVGSLDQKVYSYDPASGAMLWSTTLDTTVYGSPIIANSVVYVNRACMRSMKKTARSFGGRAFPQSFPPRRLSRTESPLSARPTAIYMPSASTAWGPLNASPVASSE